MKLKHFATDQDKETHGVWIFLGNDVWVKVARMGNPRYQEELTKLQGPHRRELRLGTMAREDSLQIYHTVLARTILLDWAGVEDTAGNPVEYSEEAAIEAFRDNPDFLRAVEALSQERETFRLEIEEAAKGNS